MDRRIKTSIPLEPIAEAIDFSILVEATGSSHISIPEHTHFLQRANPSGLIGEFPASNPTTVL
jgi:hypothetical protein